MTEDQIHVPQLQPIMEKRQIAICFEFQEFLKNYPGHPPSRQRAFEEFKKTPKGRFLFDEMMYYEDAIRSKSIEVPRFPVTQYQMLLLNATAATFLFLEGTEGRLVDQYMIINDLVVMVVVVRDNVMAKQ
jgi:hypothetical protein